MMRAIQIPDVTHVTDVTTPPGKASSGYVPVRSRRNRRNHESSPIVAGYVGYAPSRRDVTRQTLAAQGGYVGYVSYASRHEGRVKSIEWGICHAH